MKYDVTVFRIVKEKKAADYYVETHTHEYFHYIYTLGGVGKVTVDSNVIVVERGTLVMVPPNVRHSVYGIDELNSIDIKFLGNPALTQTISALGYCLRGITNYEDSLIKDIFNEAIGGNQLCTEIINARMLELLIRILRRKKKGIFMLSENTAAEHFLNTSNDVRRENIKTALKYIDHNIDKDIRVADLAQLCGYCENYFSTFFKDCMGCSPNKYINIKKIERARDMMFSTGYNVTQISEKLGFESVHYFSRMFKKVLGVPPSAYYHRTGMDVSVNLQHNAYTPKERFEFPIKKMSDD